MCLVLPSTILPSSVSFLPMRAARVKQRRRSWSCLSGMLRLCLIVSMWNGPLPWLEAHGSLAHSEELNSHLAQHLSQFHPTADLFQSAAFDWHLHFFFPGNAPTEAPAPEQPQPAAPLTISGVRVGDLTSEWNLAPSAPLPLLAVLDVPSTSPQHASSAMRACGTPNFLQSLLQGRSAKQLFGIALC